MLRRHVRLWGSGAPIGDDGAQHTGRPRARGLLDLVDVLLATGARIGEVLTLHWPNVDLATEPATLTISGTVVRLPGRMADGGGLVRQGRTKTDAGYRVGVAPPVRSGHAAAAVSGRQAQGERSGLSVVVRYVAGTAQCPAAVAGRSE